MKRYLDSNWNLSFTTLEGKHYEIPAQVPGNVIGDLFRANIIPDPYFGCNSNLLRLYEFIDWQYSTKFQAVPSSYRGLSSMDGTGVPRGCFAEGRTSSRHGFPEFPFAERSDERLRRASESERRISGRS